MSGVSAYPYNGAGVIFVCRVPGRSREMDIPPLRL